MPLSKEEKLERLEANNLTYKNDNVAINLDSYKSIIFYLDYLKQVETINDCKTDLLTYSCSSPNLIKSVEKSKLVSLSKVVRFLSERFVIMRITIDAFFAEN